MYESLGKTVTIWVNLCPTKDARNTVFFHSFYKRQQGVKDSPSPSCLDDTEVIEVNIGSSKDDGGTELLRMFNTLFDAEMNIESKESFLRDNYNISLDQSLLAEVGHMGALAEEYEIVRARGLREGREAGFAEGKAEGIEKGRAEGIEKGRAEERQRVIEAFSEKVLKFCEEHNVTAEEAVAEVVFLPDYVQEVLDAVKAASSH